MRCLSPREIEVLALREMGKTIPQIAYLLNISYNYARCCSHQAQRKQRLIDAAEERSQRDYEIARQLFQTWKNKQPRNYE